MSYHGDAIYDDYASPQQGPPAHYGAHGVPPPQARPRPPPAHANTLDPGIDLSSLRISDPTPQGYAHDPVQRTGTSHSMRSPAHQPRHAHTLPPPGTMPPPPPPQQQYYDPRQGYDTSSMYSTASGGGQRESGYDQDYAYQQHPQNGYGGPPPPRSGPTPAPYYDAPPPPPQDDGRYWAQQQGGWQQPDGGYQQHDPYANQYYQQGPPQGGYGGGYGPPQDDGASYYGSQSYGSDPSMYGDPYAHQGGYYAPSISSASTGSSDRPSIQRSGTSASLAFGNARSKKAVDVNHPPFTKEYVDQYRARIKADPDPEVHFLYAKYLIEAAKKIGGEHADQRAVRKYRDLLIGEALKVIRRLATQGDAYAEAQFFLANCYGTGMLGLQVDHEKAYHLYLQAAKQNHPAACYRVAVCNEIGAGTKRDNGRAVMFFRKSASLGDVAAMYKLGMILLTGRLDQNKDPREAVNWLKRAAEEADEDNPHALHELGLLHEMQDSSIVVHDPAYARDLFTRAAQLGYTSSQFKLGQCYEYGALTCPVDPKRSIAWYTKAAEKGDPEAELALSGWYLTGSEGVLKQSDHEAFLWARKAANKGLSKAEYAVGYYAEVGIGVKQDIDVARKYYMRAAAQGNKRAMNRLTEMKRAGNKRINPARPTRQDAKEECIIM
ncbi:HCP-like protein [Auricularia subglabra TFB-10046 SS5]|nr:HCP-like protein [Auricularia subglabra TFB-10046 SS5]